MHLAHGLAFADLYQPRRSDPAGHPVPRSPARSRSGPRRPACDRARLIPARSTRKRAFRSADRSSRRTWKTSSPSCSASSAEVAALAARHHELAPLYSVQAAVRAAPGDEPDQARRRPRRSTVRRWKRSWRRTWVGAFTELGFAQLVTQWQQDEARTRRRLELAAALRRLGRAHAGRARARTAAASCSRPRASSTTSTWYRCQADDAAGFRSYTACDALCAGARASSSPTPAPTWSARWTRPTTASGATSRAAIPARTA